jgi:hypothetical protein
VVGTDGTCTSASATVYYYDPQGQRVAKWQGNGMALEEYVYDPAGNQTSAHNGDGNLVRAELYSPGYLCEQRFDLQFCRLAGDGANPNQFLGDRDRVVYGHPLRNEFVL